MTMYSESRMWGDAALLVCALLCASFSGFGEKVLIVADEWPQMEVLASFLEEKGSYEVAKAEQNKLPDDLSGFHAVFQFVHGKLDDESAGSLIEYAQHGGRLVVMHHGISSGKAKTKGWLPFLGMQLDRDRDAANRYEWTHGVTLTLVNLNPKHYITSHDVNYEAEVEYRSSDQPSPPATMQAILFEGSEVFLNHQFSDGREKTVLFGFTYTNAKTGKTYMQDRSGWLKPAGDGYVFYFQPGHVTSDFENPNYCQILMNCLTWSPCGNP